MPDFSCEKLANGAWQCYAIVNNRLITRTYYFYTKEEAISDFAAEMAEERD